MVIKNGLKCPNCYAESRQEYDTKENVVNCRKCDTVYLYNSSNKPKYQAFSDVSDDEVTDHSDDYQPSETSDLDDFFDDQSNKNKGKQHQSHLFFSDVDSDDSRMPSCSKKYKAQKRKLSTSSNELIDDKKQKSNKEKHKSNIPKLKFSDSEAELMSEGELKIPTIFSDDFLTSPSSTIEPKIETVTNNDVLKLEFSEMEDESDFEEVSKKPKPETKPKKPKSRKSHKNDISDYIDSSSDSETEKLKMFDPKRKKQKRHSTRVSGNINSIGRYNPYIVFNQITRKKIAETNPSANSLEISALVAKAWNTLGEEQKKKFKEDLQTKKDEINAMRKIRKKRPAGNGYLLFSKEELPKVRAEHPDISSINDLSSIVGIRWKGLDQAERDRYTAIAKKERDEWIKNYPDEYQQYMDKMVNKIKATKRKQKEQEKNQKLK